MRRDSCPGCPAEQSSATYREVRSVAPPATVPLQFPETAMKLSDIAKALNAHLDNASPDTEITGVAGIEQAAPGPADLRLQPQIQRRREDHESFSGDRSRKLSPPLTTGMLRSKNPYLAWAKAIELFYQAAKLRPRNPSDRGGSSRQNQARQERARRPLRRSRRRHRNRRQRRSAGPRSHLSRSNHRQQFLRPRPRRSKGVCHLGDNVLLQNGVVVGCDGFGFAKDEARPAGTRSSSPAT